MNARIVVTGIGVVSPLGIGREAMWQGAAAGMPANAPVTLFDPSGHGVRIACEVPGFQASDYMEAKEARRLDRHQHMAVAAALLAIEDSGYAVAGDSILEGAVVSNSSCGLMALEQSVRTLLDRGPSRMSPFGTPMVSPNLAGGHIAMRLGLHGPGFSIASACASGADAIGIAADIIRRGEARMMLAGASDAPVTPYFIEGFDVIGVLSRDNEDPARASRPFDINRAGFVLGEAAVLFVLEEREAALERGAEVLCEVAGHASLADAHHITDPDPSGEPQARTLMAAMAAAGVEPSQVGYVNAHGGGSRVGDPREIAMLRRVFGDAAPTLAVSSTKAMHGHCMGASAALEAAIAAEALRRGQLPITANLADIDPECLGVDHVTGATRERRIDYAMSVNYGLGGHNAALVLRRAD